MAPIPAEVNPFKRKNLYEEFGLEPFASEEEIMAEVDEVYESFAKLSDEEKTARLSSFQEAVKILQDTSRRVQVNAMMLDKLDVKTVVARLRHVQGVDVDDVKLPEPELSQVLTEGASMELARQDFTEVLPESALQIDLDAVNDLLSSKVFERRFLFET